jgi:GT2 family glycosyltransferase
MREIHTVTVVIPVRNGRRFLAACLDSLLAQQQAAPELALQIVAVDNDSIDGSADFIAHRYPTVKLIRNTVNRGFAGGCNQGILAAPADLTILLNQDTEVHAGWVRAIVKAFADPTEGATIGVVGCKILYPDGRTLQHAGGYLQRPTMYGIHYAHHERDHGQGDQSKAVEWVTGAAFAIHRATLERVGLLDEGFWPGYFEDVDYCLRVQATGLRIWYCAEAVLSHQETSSKIDEDTIQRFYHRGRLRLSLKHLSPAQWQESFLPAERQQGLRHTLPLKSAYWDALMAAPLLLRTQWAADDGQILAILRGLRELMSGGADPAWHFEEFTFPASTPVIGGVLSAFRRLWYNVAARWGVRHLQHQVEERLWLPMEQIAVLQHQLDQLALSNAALAQTVGRLEAQLGASAPPATAQEDGSSEGELRPPIRPAAEP